MDSSPTKHIDNMNECSVCGQQTSPLYQWSRFQLLMCDVCGTQSTSPIPSTEELHSFYQSISGKKMVDTNESIGRIILAFNLYLESYRRHSEPGFPSTFLDVGRSVGLYAHAAMKSGVEATLMDYAQGALDFATDQLGIKYTINGDIQHCAQYVDGKSFDFVLSRHTVLFLRKNYVLAVFRQW